MQLTESGRWFWWAVSVALMCTWWSPHCNCKWADCRRSRWASTVVSLFIVFFRCWWVRTWFEFKYKTMSIISCIFKYFKNNMNKIKDLSTCWLYVALPLFPSARQPILSYKPFLTLRKASLLFSQPLTFIFRCFSAAASVLRSWLDLRPVKSALFSNLLGRAEV